MERPKIPPGVSLCLRTCDANLQSCGGFQWPRLGPVEAPDWDPEPACGGGLHGFLEGEGDGMLASWSEDAVWVVFACASEQVVDLGGKVKVPRAWVLYAGERSVATSLMQGTAVIGGAATAGDYGTAVAGDYGTATVGDNGTAVTGNRGTAVAGDRGTATAGHGGCATVGYGGTATAGHGGTVVAGDHGTATVGESGTATAGARGTVVAGAHGTAATGFRGTATVGNYGTATAGEGGTIMIRWWDENTGQYRVAVGYPGEGDIEPNKPYRCTSSGELILAD